MFIPANPLVTPSVRMVIQKIFDCNFLLKKFLTTFKIFDFVERVVAEARREDHQLGVQLGGEGSSHLCAQRCLGASGTNAINHFCPKTDGSNYHCKTLMLDQKPSRRLGIEIFHKITCCKGFKATNEFVPLKGGSYGISTKEAVKARSDLIAAVLQWNAAVQRQEFSYLSAELQLTIAGRSRFVAYCEPAVSYGKKCFIILLAEETICKLQHQIPEGASKSAQRAKE